MGLPSVAGEERRSASLSSRRPVVRHVVGWRQGRAIAFVATTLIGVISAVVGLSAADCLSLADGRKQMHAEIGRLLFLRTLPVTAARRGCRAAHSLLGIFVEGLLDQLGQLGVLLRVIQRPDKTVEELG